MFKKTLLFMLLMTLLAPWAVAQETLTVYDGATGTSTYVPVYGTWADAYLKCEFIVPATELDQMTGGTITQMDFAVKTVAAAAWTGTFQVFMKEVSETTLSAWTGTTGATIVYEGTLDGTADPMTVTFSNSYTYGGGNLLIGFYQTVKGNFKGITFYGETVTGASGSNYNSSSLDNVTFSQRNFVPTTTFTYDPASGGCDMPTDIAVSNITTDGATVTWDGTGSTWNLRYKASSDADYTFVNGLTAKTYNLSGLTSNTGYSVGVQTDCGGGSTSSFKSTSFTTANACAAPTNLQFSNITNSSATLTWTPGYQETTWTVKYKKSTDTEYKNEETVNGTPTITLSGLDGLTTYNVQVYNCENYVTGNFTTAASLPLVEGFAATSAPTGWNRYAGQLNSNGTATLTTSGTWSFGTSNGVFDSHAKSNIYNTGCFKWLVTPSLPMEDNVQLTFDVALTKYSGTLQEIDKTLGEDDRFLVLLTTDNGATWNTLREWNNTGAADVYNDIPCTAVGQSIAIDLSSYAGQYIAIAFYGESTVAESGSDNYLHIDNVSIDYIPSCAKPTGLGKDNVTAHTVDLSWTSEESAWVVAYKKTADTDYTEVNVTTNPYTLSGLDPETAYTAKVKTDCSGTYSEWSNEVSFTTTIACPAPTGLAATLTPGNGSIASLGWTSTASEWVVAYKKAADTDYTEVNVTENPYTLTGLTAEETYEAKVKAVCGGIDGESEWSSTITFTPTDSYFLTVNEGTNTNSYVPFYGYYADSDANSQFIIPASDLASIQWGHIQKLTFYGSNASATWTSAVFDVYVSEVSNTEFDNAELTDWSTMTLVYTGSVSVADNKMVLTLTEPYQYLGGNLMIGFDETTNSSNYPQMPWYGVTQTTNTAVYQYSSNAVTLAKFLPKVTFNYTPGTQPSCNKPTGLAVNYTGGDEATVSWTSDATAWNIDVNGTVTAITENPYTLTGLSLATNYEVKVQADCGSNGTSDWTSAVSFTTDMCLAADMCAITITMTDAYSDGGGKIEVVDVLTNAVLGSYTNSSASTSYTLNVCDGRDINFVFTATDSWPYENGWVITDVNNEIISQHEGCTSSSGCTAPTDGVIATYTVNCTISNCKTPTALAASEIGNHSVKLNWTENGDASSWKVAYTLFGETKFTEVDANAKPFTLTGLNPITHYTVKVRPVCSDFDNKWSDEIDFTTDVACPAPTALTAVSTPFDAEISWTGSASAYTIQYAEVPSSKDGGLWLQYDDNTPATNLGSSSSGTWTWGVMYPASMLQLNNTLTKIAFQETTYQTGDITVNIYSGGDTAPGTLVGTETVTPSGSTGMREVTLTTPLTINPLQNLWITLTTTGTYVMPMCSSTEPNNQWVYSSGTWACVCDMGFGTNGWMIRGYVEGFDPASYSWTTVNGVTSPYTITGLDPETTYVVRVKADCGSDGESVWSTMITFTTPSNCAAPTSLDATSILPTEATLNWTGYQSNFNIQYRTSATWDLSYSEGFESGIPSTWTTIDSDGDGNNWLTLNEVSTTYPAGNYGSLSGWAHTGSNAATSPSYVNNIGSFDADNWLISPQLDLKDNLRFFVMSTDATYLDSYEVLLSTTGTATTDFTTTLQTMGNASSGTWDEVIIDLSSYSGKGYIAIHHVSSDKYFLVVDDFGIGVPVAEGAWVDATSTTTTLNITGLTPETDYDWQVQGVNTKCDPSGTTDWSSMGHFTTLPDEPIAILNNGLWNAPTTWDDGTVPPANSSVIINGDVIVPTGYTAVADEITIVNGSITIQEGGQLQHSNEIPVTFNMTVNPYTAKSGANGYRLIATPVYTTSSYSIPVTATGLATGTFDLYSFDQSKQLEWRNYEASAFTDLDMGYGYLYANAGSVSPTFSGNTIPTSPVTFTDLPLATATDGLEFVGWHLLGNPFTCNCYITNGTSGIAFYKMKAGGSELEAVDAGTSVAPMEGFFVQVTSATNTTGFQITAPAKSGSSLGITLNQGTTKVDNAFISFSNGQTLEKIQLDPNHSKVYMPVDGKDYAVASAGNQGEMPINFKAETNGTYTLNFSSEDTNFSYLHLIDNMTGEDVDLLATPSYTFDAQYTDYASRFKLVFATSNNSDDQFGFISNGQLILTGLTGNETLQMIDALGRVIVSTNATNQMSIDNMAAGVYVLRLINGNDVKTQKIVVK